MTTSKTNGPLLTGSVSVVPGVTYGVQLKLMMGDLDSTDEWADLFLDGRSSGRCGDNAHSLADRSCDWLSCDSGLSDLTSANSVISISLQYSTTYTAEFSGPCIATIQYVKSQNVSFILILIIIFFVFFQH